MPSITVQSILTKAKTLVQDVTGVRHPDTELIGWFNDGQIEVSTIRTDACSILAPVPLVQGTLQSIPSEGSALLKLTRNMGIDGAAPGRAIRKVPMDLLDGQVPDWHYKTAKTEIQHYVLDPRMPRQFYVYPPAVAGTQVEELYAAPPVPAPLLDAAASTYTQTGTVVTVSKTAHGLRKNGWVYFVASTGATPSGFYRVVSTATDTFTFAAPTASTSGNSLLSSVISVDDVYSVPLIDYCCFRAYAKDDDQVGNSERAAAHRQLFLTSLAAKTQADGANAAAAKADTFGDKQ